MNLYIHSVQGSNGQWWQHMVDYNLDTDFERAQDRARNHFFELHPEFRQNISTHTITLMDSKIMREESPPWK